MPATIYVYCNSSDGSPDRCDLEEALEEFFGAEAEDCGAGTGCGGFNLDFAVADGVDLDVLANRLKEFLVLIGVDPSTYFDVFCDNWTPGMEWRRVEVYGKDQRLTEQP